MWYHVWEYSILMNSRTHEGRDTLKLSSEKLSKLNKILIPAAIILALAGTVILFRDSVIPGWHNDGHGEYFITLPFKRTSGIVSISGNDYIFSDYGNKYLIHGWTKVDGFYYYCDQNGVVAKGEREIDGEMWNFDTETGILYKNAAFIIDGKLWYFDSHGFKVSGIMEFDGEKYFFNEEGNLKHGLTEYDGKLYYFDPKTEEMKYGLITVDGDMYYFGEDGAAVTDEAVTIDGFTYYFDSDGKRVL